MVAGVAGEPLHCGHFGVRILSQGNVICGIIRIQRDVGTRISMLSSLFFQLGQCARVYRDRDVDVDFSVVFGAVRGLSGQIYERIRIWFTDILWAEKIS